MVYTRPAPRRRPPRRRAHDYVVPHTPNLLPPPDKPPAIYIVVFQVRRTGQRWQEAEHFVAPVYGNSQAEVQALFRLAGGFELLFNWRAEYRDRDKWKVSAAYENARVYLNKRRTTLKQFQEG